MGRTKSMAVTKKAKEQNRIKELEFKESYVFNPDTKQYIVFLKSAGKPIVVDEDTHKAMLNAYCGPDERAVEEICDTFNFPIQFFSEYKKIFNWTRVGLPLTDEEILKNPIEESVGSVLIRKKFEVYQELQKEEWKQTQEEANAFKRFKARVVSPFDLALQSWQVPVFKKFAAPKAKKTNPKTWVAGLSDLHYGASAKERYMFSQKNWTTLDTVAAVSKYAHSIIADAKSRNYNFDKAIIVSLGDLIHSLNGKTVRGTELKYDCIREEQFDYALTSLCHFIETVAREFPEVEVHSVYGNHNYETEMALFRALSLFFKPQKSIRFYPYSTRPAAFKSGSTLFLMDHGADDVERTYVPQAGKGLESHVQSLLLQRPDLLNGVKTKLFLQGDKHHWENIEYSNFEFIMFSTSLVGDQHSSTNNLNNRARQSSLVIDENGLKEIIHTYFN